MIFHFRQVHAGCHARTRLRGGRGFKEGHTDQRRIVMFLRSCKILQWWEWSKVMIFSKYNIHAPAHLCSGWVWDKCFEHSSAFLSRMPQFLLALQPYVCCLQPLEDSYHKNDTHWVGWKEHEKNHWSHQLDIVHAPLCAYHFPSVELLQSHCLTKPRFDGGGFFAHFPFFRKISQFNFFKDILAAGNRLDFVKSWNRLNNPNRANTMIVVFVIHLGDPVKPQLPMELRRRDDYRWRWINGVRTRPWFCQAHGLVACPPVGHVLEVEMQLLAKSRSMQHSAPVTCHSLPQKEKEVPVPGQSVPLF